MRPLVAGALGLGLSLVACNQIPAESAADRELRERRDRAVIAQLKAVGTDMSQPHQLEHHFVADTEDAARKAAAAATRTGFEVSALTGSAGPDGPLWTFDAIGATKLEEEAVIAQSAKATRIARAHGIQYDGWGTEVVRPPAEDGERGTMNAGETEDPR